MSRRSAVDKAGSIYTLMHDPQYRLGIVWQNVVYNKPPHPSFFLGDGMMPPPKPSIHLIGTGEAIDGRAVVEESPAEFDSL